MDKMLTTQKPPKDKFLKYYLTSMYDIRSVEESISFVRVVEEYLPHVVIPDPIEIFKKYCTQSMYLFQNGELVSLLSQNVDRRFYLYCNRWEYVVTPNVKEYLTQNKVQMVDNIVILPPGTWELKDNFLTLKSVYERTN